MRQLSLIGFHESLIESSVATLQQYEHRDYPYYGCFSGGKDSVVIKRLAEIAGVSVEWHYNVTTIDPPELVLFIKRKYKDVIFNLADRNFFTAMLKKGFPTRVARWCCKEFKESKPPDGSRLIIGIRAAESPRRAANWQTFTLNRQRRGEFVCPILHWKRRDVWQFIEEQNLSYCSLYDEGYKRLGCIGCPMSGKKGRERDFARWPRYEVLWKKAFAKLWELKHGTIGPRSGKEWFGSAKFSTWEELFEWWKSDESTPDDICQGPVELFV